MVLDRDNCEECHNLLVHMLDAHGIGAALDTIVMYANEQARSTHLMPAVSEWYVGVAETLKQCTKDSLL